MVFNEELDLDTVSDGIKLYKITSDNTEVEEDITVNKIGNSLAALIMSKSDNSKFTEGEIYKLSINNLRSIGWGYFKRRIYQLFCCKLFI